MNQMFRMRSFFLHAPDSEKPSRRQTVEEYLRDGGKITQCPAGRAHQSIEGALIVDGETFSVIPAGTEAIPQMARISVELYDRGLSQATQPFHHLAWRDIERESAPAVVRKQWEGRYAESDDYDRSVPDGER